MGRYGEIWGDADLDEGGTRSLAAAGEGTEEAAEAEAAEAAEVAAEVAEEDVWWRLALAASRRWRTGRAGTAARLAAAAGRRHAASRRRRSPRARAAS